MAAKKRTTKIKLTAEKRRLVDAFPIAIGDKATTKSETRPVRLGSNEFWLLLENGPAGLTILSQTLHPSPDAALEAAQEEAASRAEDRRPLLSIVIVRAQSKVTSDGHVVEFIEGTMPE